MGVVSNLRFAVQRRRGRSARPCLHLDAVREVVPSSTGCAQCIALGDSWVHLRLCMTCGLVGCCDSSKNKHAHRHADQATHPIARSFEPGESWMWCFIDEVLLPSP
jgi:monovalent cation:H+ antiporter-2, CPA2 family